MGKHNFCTLHNDDHRGRCGISECARRLKCPLSRWGQTYPRDETLIPTVEARVGPHGIIELQCQDCE